MAEPADAVRVVIDTGTGIGSCLSYSTAVSGFPSFLKNFLNLFPVFCIRALPENAMNKLRNCRTSLGTPITEKNDGFSKGEWEVPYLARSSRFTPRSTLGW